MQNVPAHPLTIIRQLPLAFIACGAIVTYGCADGSARSGRHTVMDGESRKTSQHAVRPSPESLLKRRPA